MAVSLAQFGLKAAFITMLPVNALGDACITFLRGHGVDTTLIQRGGTRMGLYFLEAGANQRPSRVIYDRAPSAVMEASPQAFDWDHLLQGASWLHITGITPALSAGMAEIAIAAMQAARNMGLTVSCDYNYRKNLWKYGKRASEVMPALVGLADVGIANEEDCQLALGIDVESSAATGDQIDAVRYQQLSEKVMAAYPKLKYQAITLRESLSADRNGWSACLNNGQTFMMARRYDVADIVDRIGTGDAFAAGLIYGLSTGMPDSDALEFATAASCLKHSIPGDMNFSSSEEVRQLLAGSASGRIQR